MEAYIHTKCTDGVAEHSFYTQRVPHRIRACDGRIQVLYLSRWRNVGNRGYVKAPEGEEWRVTYSALEG